MKPGYRVRIRASRRELVKDDGKPEDGEEEEKVPDLRIRASRREIVWKRKGELEEDPVEEQKVEEPKPKAGSEESEYFGGKKIRHLKSKEELANPRVGFVCLFVHLTFNFLCLEIPFPDFLSGWGAWIPFREIRK